MKRTKRVEELEVDDFRAHPVWQFARSTSRHVRVSPVSRLPVSSFDGRIVGLQVTLANGSTPWCTLANLSVYRPLLNQHFLAVSIERGGSWFHLARYFDFDFGERGPVQLAAFLQLKVDDVFPVRYDVRPYANGTEACLVGEVTAEPCARLSQDELISLSLS